MKQNIVFWVGVNSNSTLLQQKHGNFNYLDYSKFTWQYWCKKHNIIFYEYNSPTCDDTETHRVTWQRWFDVFDQIDQLNIDFNKIAVIDGSSMIKWDAPNFFNLCSDNLVAFRSLENLRWISEGVQGYKHLFDNFEFDITKYISCGFQIFDKKHKDFLTYVKQYYYDNLDMILKLQSEVSRGTDQPVYNYLLQIKNIKVDSLPEPYMLTHMNRFNWFSYNWQLNEDQTPYFIKYGYIWFFSGFDRTQRNPLMKQTWDIIKHYYE
jgi:hypothetical protein